MTKKRSAVAGVTLEHIEGLLDELKGMSDRAAAIVGAAFLDELLRYLIASFLVDDEKVVGELLKNQRYLGTFNARIGAAYCLGLITKDEYHDLRMVQKVRNEFAHALPGLFFTDQRISNRCNELTALPPELAPKRFMVDEYGSEARYLFSAAVHVLSMRLMRASIDMQKDGVRRVVRVSP